MSKFRVMLSFSFVSAAKFECSPTPGGPLGGLSVGRGIPKGTELRSGAKRKELGGMMGGPRTYST